MASIRRGYSDDFTLNNNPSGFRKAASSSVGIGTSVGQEALDVVDGAVKGQDLKVTGISSFTAYEGFLRADHQIAENTTLSFDQGPVSSLSGEIIVGTGQTVTVNEIVKETTGVGNGSGDQWFDINGNHAFKKTGTPTWNGNTFTLDGTDDYFTASGGDKDDFGFGTGDFTIEMWINATDVASIVPYDTRPASTNGDYTTLFIDSTTPNFYVNGANRISGSSGDFAANVWNHFVVSRISATTKMYINGVQKGSDYSDSTNYLGSSGRPFIGAQSRTEGNSDVTGQISIVRVYKGRGLTAAEITQNYNAGYTATTSAVAATVDLNANNPASYPGTVRDVDTTDATRAGGSEIECLKVYNTFTPPSGGTNERPYAPKPGELYYNYDFKTIEFFDGYGWRQVDNTTRSGRGVFGGGLTPHPAVEYLSTIDYVQIPTLGNAVHFGDLSAARRRVGGVSSETRGIFVRGTNSSNTRTNIMEYITIASGGDAINFGDAGVTGSVIGDADGGCCSSSTRGIQAGGGQPGNHNIITFIQISTLGDAQDFGDLSEVKHQISSFSSPVRAIHYSGYKSAGVFATSVDTHMIAAKGDAVDFTEPLIPRYGSNALSNSTRGIICTGQAQKGAPSTSYPGYMTAMNTSSQGTEIFFGTDGGAKQAQSAASTQTRGVFAGGYGPGSGASGVFNTIDYVTIQTLGDSIDFGDLTAARGLYGGISDSHGGLGGF